MNQSLAIALILMFLLTLNSQSQIITSGLHNPEFRLPSTHDDSIESDVVLGHVEYSITNTPSSFDGYNLFVLYQQPLVENQEDGDILLIMDMNGNVVAQKQIGSAQPWNCPVEFIDPNTILLATDNGSTLWHLETDTFEELGYFGRHEFEYNPNSNTVFTFVTSFENIDGIDCLYQTIMEYDSTGTPVWSWNVSDFIPPEWWCPYHDMDEIYRDISHSNTIYYDADEDIIYYMSRNTNTFFKLNHTSKEVIWGLGEYGNFTLYDLQGNVCDELFYHAHSVEPVDENTFILFDNDRHNQTDENNRISRMVEIKIDENTMTANESWYYEASTLYFSAGWGDADRLPNGNRIGTWGSPKTPFEGPAASIIEVNEDHEVVWSLDIQYSEYFTYGIYRMERFRYTPIISSPDDIVTVNSSLQLSWDAWYNFRNKYTLPGNYTLYIDGVPSQSGLFNYTKYWRSTTISIETGPIALGIHNVTLEIDDGYGNKASDSINATVKSFDINRTGRTSIEKGQTESLPTWSGATASELFCNITLNNTLYDEINWTGQDIALNPDLIALGTHYVYFQLFNGSLKVYEDTFWLQVGPMEPPLILPLHAAEVTILWNDPLTLSWNLSDSTPNSWSILYDGTEVVSGDWFETTFTLNWDVPLYPEGTHNITLVARDLLGQWTKSEMLLIINPPILPFILSAPENTTIAWGKENVLFEWETYNAETWTLWRNNVVFGSGAATSGHITLTIVNWLEENWRIGRYNMTLQVMKNGYYTTHTFWLLILANPGDPYADAVMALRSNGYLDGDNAIDAPDGEYAVIYTGYTNGYLTLDMGENEEIVDGDSYDFTIYASGGEYSVSVTNTPSAGFTFLATGTGMKSFDISPSGLSEVQYVRIAIISGVTVEVDAIEAINYNIPPGDTTPPTLAVYGDWYRLPNGTSATLIWSASDETPWSYEIYENSTLVFSDSWNGSDIHYLFEPSNVGWWNVTLVAYDVFDNIASDVVMIEVYVPANNILLITSLILGISAVVVIAIILLKKKEQI